MSTKFGKAVLMLGVFLATSIAPAGDIFAQNRDHLTLRAETKIFVEGRKPALVGETLTLFDSAVVYDVQLPDRSQIAVFDIPRSTIILLDAKRKLRTTIKSEDLIQFMTALKQQAIETGKSETIGIHTQPHGDPKTGIYQAGFPGFLYVAQTQPASRSELAHLYSEFTGWAIRLNTYQHPHGAPFARLALNEQMSVGGVLPQSITLKATMGEQTDPSFRASI
ncbi:MAG: hypothetical protein R3C05_31390 [Pirellulaceae bacterium]